MIGKFYYLEICTLNTMREMKKNVEKESSWINGTSSGAQPFGFSGPHWKKKSCLGPHIKYTNTNKNR